jgi:HEAT repeat protein
VGFLLPLLLLALSVVALPAQEPVPPFPPVPAPAPRAAEVEALVAQSQSPDAKLSTEALVKLADLGSAAVPVLTQGLWSDSYTVRRQSANLLGLLGGDARSAAPSLVRVLKDDGNTESRAEAARSLALVWAHSAIPALTKALKDEAAVVRLAAAESLIALGAEAEVVLPALTKSLKSGRPAEQQAAAQLLGDLGPEAAPAVLALQEALVDADALVTYRIAEALGRIGAGAKDAVPLLKSKAKDHREAAVFRVPSAVALWRINRDPDAAELLRKALAEKKATRPLPHDALLRIDPSPESVEEIAKHLKSEDEKEVAIAAAALGKRAKEIVPRFVKPLTELAKVLQGEPPPEGYNAAKGAEDAQRAIAVLGAIGPGAKPALEPLRVLAKEKRLAIGLPAAVLVYQLDPKPDNALVLTEFLENKDERLAAAEALKQLRPTGKAVAVELLVALDSTDDEFRLAAACALWRVEKNPAALKAAVKSLRAAGARIRERAAVEIGAEFGPDAKPAVPDLVKRLFDSHAAVRSATAEALGRVGPGAKDAAPALVAVLEGDEPAFVQSAACEALGLVEPADKEAALAALKPKLEHPAPLVRVHAALAMFRVAGDKSGEQEAIRGLGSRSHQVRITAAEALWRMGKDGRSIPLLIRALEESNLSGTEGENERYMAARALGRVGPDAKDAVPELLKLIDARDPDLAATARAALKAIDPDAAKNAGIK